MTEPINNIQWLDVNSLNANDYNPNVVFNPELRLLEKSILSTGWVQPILVLQDGTIIDGFHRYSLSKDSKAIKDKYHGKVPCAVLDITRAEAMLLTIRMNRAKGTHVALRMSEIVHSLIDDYHMDRQEIAQNIGATLEEIDLLYQDNVFKKKDMKNYQYSKAWVPHENKKK